MCVQVAEKRGGVYLAMREEATLCAGGERRWCYAWAGAVTCVWRRWEQANVRVDEGRRTYNILTMFDCCFELILRYQFQDKVFYFRLGRREDEPGAVYAVVTGGSAGNGERGVYLVAEACVLHVGRGRQRCCAGRRKKRGGGGADGLRRAFRGEDGDDGETEKGPAT
ncbi:hypothetical protein MRB53_024789 [Persea americana]|uniref:Uncharacterized protein n=1 Tax=Persea americana TaxID=3435 RepID=A0ACC2LDE5_PERAE|nr:hypothetical protein MRB53_024789 [Persea americana]